MDALKGIDFSWNTFSICAGAFFLLFSSIRYIQLRKLSTQGIRTSATVVDLIRNADAHGPDTYSPVLEYMALSGEKVTKKSYLGHDKSHSPNIGDKVEILYDPDHPEKFLLYKGIDRYWKLIGTLIMGVVFLGAGLLKLF